MRVYDDWELSTLRTVVSEADGSDVGAEQWARENLAAAEAQRLHVHSTDHGLSTERSFGQRTQGPAHSNYSTPAVACSPAQERFIRSLCAERGVDADFALSLIKNKAQASKAIDDLKAMPRQWATPTGDLADARPVRTERPATERQVEFLQDLLATRAHDYDPADPKLSTFSGASAAITELLDSPRIRLNSHGIRPGRYAYEPAGAPAQFYRVQANGRIVVQAGPSEHPYNGQLNEALLAIQADVREAAALYGRLIGRCGRCGLELTDETSRSLGLGPICAGKSDW